MADRTTTFSPETARAIARYVREQLRITPTPTNPLGGRLNTKDYVKAKIIAKTTVGDVVQHSWQQVYWDFETMAYIPTPDGKSGTTTANFAISYPDKKSIETNAIVDLERQEDPLTGKNIWLRVIPCGQPFMVLVTKDGGSDGDASTKATWTYTVKNLSGETLVTNQTLNRDRPYGLRNYGGVYGIAFYDVSNTLKLIDAGEYETALPCEIVLEE